MSTIANINPREVLRMFESARFEDIAGVMLFDSGKDGPTAAITACTHGNEPCGLYAIEHIRRLLTLGQKLLSGQLFLVVNNLRAAEASLFPESRIVCRSPTARYVDLNMNRLPADLTVYSGSAYEVLRARELMPIWKQFEFALDFHSTSKDSPPMIVTGWDKFPAAQVRGMGVSRVLSNIDMVQIGKPAFAFYGQNREHERVFEIEAGQHTLASTYKRSVKCAEKFLRNLGMIERKRGRERLKKYRVYRVYGYLKLPSSAYKLVRRFGDFEKVNEGEILASGPGPDQVVQRDSCTLFCPNDIEHIDPNEEAIFLTERPTDLFV